MKYDLPRPHLSNSSYTLWRSSKEQFRKRYYENQEGFQTKETNFGKKIAKMLENGEFVNDKIIIYPNPEYRIYEELEPGLMLLGYLDSFDPETCSILEYKTGRLSNKGKVPWDNLKVRKQKQLVFYSLLSQLKHNKVNPKTTLQWIETELKDDTREFDGHILTAGKSKLSLTGKVETFEREIAQWEIDNLKEDILLAAKEITEDYKIWKNQQKNN